MNKYPVFVIDTFLIQGIIVLFFFLFPINPLYGKKNRF